MWVVSTEETATSSDSHSLLNEKLNLTNIELAAGVINMNHCFCKFLWSINVLLEGWPHGGDTLIDAAPCSNLWCFLLLLTDFELFARFSDCENLLIFHVLRTFLGEEDCLNEVLYFCLWSFACGFVVNVHRGRQTHRELERKVNLVTSGVQHTVYCEDRLFVF